MMYTQDAFTNAILKGDFNQVKLFVEEGFDLEAFDAYGFTPLIEATLANQIEMVALFLEKGVLVDQPDITGRTALHWAVDNNAFNICCLLLKNHADPNQYTKAGQPILVFPYLRGQKVLQKLLCDHNAQISFAQDFIQVKLIGHRYALRGQADIIDPEGKFVSVDYEGFFLEFVVEIIQYSLNRYYHHFMARPFGEYFGILKTITQLFQCASQLLQYQKYIINIQEVSENIDQLLNRDFLFLPLGYAGHAISFIRYQDIFIRCDRGENSKKEGSIVIYRMHKPNQWTNDFIKNILYQRQSAPFMTTGIQSVLGLKRVGNIPLSSQLVGNCSWANMEASVLALLYLLKWKEESMMDWSTISIKEASSHTIYESWLAWDKSRALEESLQNFQYVNPARKATIATVLGAILFQTYCYENDKDIIAARKLMPVLASPDYQYVLKTYLKVYWKDNQTKEGYNLVQLLNACGILLS